MRNDLEDQANPLIFVDTVGLIGTISQSAEPGPVQLGMRQSSRVIILKEEGVLDIVCGIEGIGTFSGCVVGFLNRQS